VWGEDPNVASSGQPGFDVGTSVPRLSSLTATKYAALAQDANGDGLISRGDTITYTILVENTGISPFSSVVVSDTLPAETSYVSGSTSKDLAGVVSVINDNGVPPSITTFPLDEGGIEIGTNMPVGAKWAVRFRVLINPNESLLCDPITIVNTAYVNGDGESVEIDASNPLLCVGTVVVEKKIAGPQNEFNYTSQAFNPGNSEPDVLPDSFTLTPPDVRVRPRFDGRDPGIEVNLPLIEGRF
jgi:uncharacterized repeat protein (TIGR01451 family)